MKKSILLIISFAFAITLSSCQSANAKDKDTTTKEPSSSSISAQTEATSKDKISNQTKAASKDELANTTNKDVNFEEIYDNFLSGQIDAADQDRIHRNLSYYLNLDADSQENNWDYAIYDMNGDEIPELLIRGRISLYIFWIYNNELALWRSDVNYSKPLNNMALLYERSGGAPDHIDYMYIVPGYQGEDLYKIEFAKYSNWIVEGVDYGEKYFINNTEVTKGTYDSLSERFINIGDDKIEWKAFSY